MKETALTHGYCSCKGGQKPHPLNNTNHYTVDEIELPLLLLQDSSAAVQDEESCIHQALMKYLDAWCLSPDSWEYSLHVGRLLLLQGRSREALQHLQSGLAMRPLHPALRSGHITIFSSLSIKRIIIYCSTTTTTTTSTTTNNNSN